MPVETQNDKYILENAPFDATHFSDGVYIKVDGSNMFEWVKYTDENEYDWDAVSYDHNGRFLSDIKRLVDFQELNNELLELLKRNQGAYMDSSYCAITILKILDARLYTDSYWEAIPVTLMYSHLHA